MNIIYLSINIKYLMIIHWRYNEREVLLMNEQIIKLEKVKKSCKTAKKITKVITMFLIAVIILCIVGAILCFGFKDSINLAMAKQSENLTFSNVDIGGILRFSVDISGLMAEGKYAEISGIYCIISVIICVICAMVFGILSKVFAFLENSDTPFSETVLKKMKLTFILLVAIMALLIGIGMAAVIGLYFWCIYCILDYGIMLQIEVDDTI